MSANRILTQRRCADLPLTTSDAGKCIEWQCWLAKLHTWFEYLCLKKLFKCVHFSFTICNVFLSGPWSQQHRGPYKGWAEQQNSQDAEPRGSGPWPRNGCPLHHLRGGRGLYSSKLTTASATCYPLRSKIDRQIANDIKIFEIWSDFQGITKKNEIMILFLFYILLKLVACEVHKCKVHYCSTT